MTIDQIKAECCAIIALAEKATPGPWISHNVGLGDVFSTEHTWISSVPLDASIAAIRRGCGEAGGEKENAADASFIASSRSFTPKAARVLLTAIDALEDAIPKMRGKKMLKLYNDMKSIQKIWEEPK